MNTRLLFRRLFVNDPLIKKFSRTPRFSYSKSSEDGDGKKDDSPESKIDLKDIKKAITDLDLEKNENIAGEDEPDASGEVKKSGFLKAFEKFQNLKHEEDSTPETTKKPSSEKKKRSYAKKLSKSDFDVLFNPDSEKESIKDDFSAASVQPKEPKGFAKAFKKFSDLDNLLEEEPEEKEPDSDSKKEQQTFAYLLRNSKFIDLGDPEGKVVIGKIYHTAGNDLYIDFGWKFPTVCQKPPVGGENYIRGARVRLLIKDLELSTRFLGSTTDTTLREADCVLLGLAKTTK